jgi:hypothetical protein
MNKLMELVLAKEVAEIAERSSKNKDYVVYELSNKLISEEGAYSGIEIIREIMSQGVSPLVVINYNNKIGTLFEHICKSSKSESTIDYFLSLIKKEDVERLSSSMVDKIFELSEDYTNSKLMESFFKLGFNFQQGTLNEIDKALVGNINFFEICMEYKKDFKFSFKYPQENNRCLDEILAEDIDYCKKNGISEFTGLREGLLIFLTKARQKEELKNSLENNLIINLNSSTSSIIKV